MYNPKMSINEGHECKVRTWDYLVGTFCRPLQEGRKLQVGVKFLRGRIKEKGELRMLKPMRR